MSTKLGKKKSKNTNYFSHEFLISNHGDIVSIFAMFFVCGLMFKRTTPLASKFIILQHNTTATGTSHTMYTTGFYDLCALFFYTLLAIVVHAVIQEYLLDKYTKKMAMTKTRLSRFNYSAQLSIFFAVSVFYICDILYHDGLIKNLSDLWDGYPHTPLSLWAKFFFIFQISYWLHNFPEIYFQKVKKDDVLVRVLHSSLFLLGIGIGYWMNFVKLCLAVLLVQYSTDFVYHLSRAYYLATRTNISRIGFLVWDSVFIPARVIIACLAFLTLQYGMSRQSKPTVNLSTGDFNTRLIRINAMLFILFCQAYMLYNFVTYHLRRRREVASQAKQSSLNRSIVTTTNVDIMNQKKREKKKMTQEEKSR